MPNDVFVVLCPDGCMTYDDMHMCKTEKWVPIAVLKHGDDVTVPCFDKAETALKFGRRNFPKDWLAGVIALTLGEIKWVIAKGWKMEVLNYPKLFKDLPEFTYEVLEFQSAPDLYMKRS